MFDQGAILQLPTVLRRALDTAREVKHHLPLVELPHFSVALVGPVDGGKTALVHALLGLPSGIPILGARPRLSKVPVEYLFGNKGKLHLGLCAVECAPLSWVEGKFDDERCFARPDLRFLRVETPSPILAEWNVRLVDYPSIDGAEDLMLEKFSGLSQPDTGVLYVVSGRGLTDADTQALELLRRQRVTVIETIREEELVPTRSLLDRVDLPGLSCPFVVPIIAARTGVECQAQGHPEQTLLRNCVALLRVDSMIPGQLGRIRQVARRMRSELRTELVSRLTQVYAVQESAYQIDHLYAVADAWKLKHDSSRLEPLEESLTELLATLERIEALASFKRQELLLSDVNSTIDQYNVEAGKRSDIGGTPPTVRVMDFGARYVGVRNDLTCNLKNILDQKDPKDKLELNQGERESLEALITEVDKDRIEIALLGCFSSGKSSLINALLGVPADDNSRKLLPTSVRPETATVNMLEYADNTVLSDVSWLDQASLTFLSKTDHQWLRVHIDEIKAFHTWIHSGEVIAANCSFNFLALTGEPHQDPLKAFDIMWRKLDFPDRARQCAYPNSDEPTPKIPDGSPAGVKVRLFEHHVSDWPKPATLQQAFDAVKEDPAVALRVKYLHVGFDHPLLQHASIIDTPGTDAPIPHHREVARGIIKEKRCPVLYCFLGTKVGGKEDRENLKKLKEWGIGTTELSRFFFVITMQGRVDIKDHNEVRKCVKDSLKEIGVEDKQLYFTEVMGAQNEDFQLLKRDISHFVARSRLQLFSSWIANAYRVMGDVRGRYEKRLQTMAEDENSRVARWEQLKNEARLFETIAAEFERSTYWGVAWAEERVSSVVAAQVREIDALIAALDNREAFDGLADALIPAFEDVNTAGKQVVRTVTEGISGKLKSKIIGQLPNRVLEIRPMLLQDDHFLSAGVLEAVGRVEFPSLWWFRWEETKREAIIESRERIALPWRTARAAGLASINGLLRETFDHLRREIRRISQGIGSELEHCGQREAPESKEALTKQRDHAKAWLGRFEALERKFQEETG